MQLHIPTSGFFPILFVPTYAPAYVKRMYLFPFLNFSFLFSIFHSRGSCGLIIWLVGLSDERHTDISFETEKFSFPVMYHCQKPEGCIGVKAIVSVKLVLSF